MTSIYLGTFSKLYGWKKLHNFKQLWDVFIREETSLKPVSINYNDEDDVPNLTLIKKVRGVRKGEPQAGLKAQGGSIK